MFKRGSGILLHISSLPSPHGIGDLGPGAYRFVDFLAESGQRYWQILPLIPTDPFLGNSPYNGPSLFAFNPLFISLEILARDGYIPERTVKDHPPFPGPRVDYQKVVAWKLPILEEAFEGCRSSIEADASFQDFLRENAFWLEDYGLFMALKRELKGSWLSWPEEVRGRGGLEGWKERFRGEILREEFYQFLFFRQWQALKGYCNQKGIRIIGDMPIYPSFESADVWANPSIFKLTEDMRPAFVAGVPPDYFSPTGQLWGNPVYDWDRLREDGYRWWIERIGHNLRLYDMVRLDHFRGFVAYWEVPAGQDTAMNGRWVGAPAYEFFTTLKRSFPSLPIIAEDLGTITPDVREVKDSFGLPGMKVLLFAFGEDDPGHPYLPHNYERNCLVYTGTHDTNTVLGWFRRETGPEERERLFRYIGRRVGEGEVHREMARLAMASVADLSILPMQDVLGLGEEGRMNLPGRREGNWEWRLGEESVTERLKEDLYQMVRTYGRA